MHRSAAMPASAPVPLDLEAFHRGLDRVASAHLLNESVIEERLFELERADSPRDPAFWLAYARLAELALFCAGGYADSGEIDATGDLLVNPRRVEVFLKGKQSPIFKERHTPLTVQFAHLAPDRVSVAGWLARNAVVRVRRQAILPHMVAALEASEVVPDACIRSLDSRIKRLADVLVARCLPGAHTASARCGFDLERFHALNRPPFLVVVTRQPSWERRRARARMRSSGSCCRSTAERSARTRSTLPSRTRWNCPMD